MVNLFRAAAALAALVGMNSSLSSALRPLDINVINQRANQGMAPLSGMIGFHRVTPNTTTLPEKPRNVTTYLLGKAPSADDPASLAGFIAQYPGDIPTSSSYYMPTPDIAPGAEIANAFPNRRFKVHRNGTAFTTPGTMISGRIYVVDGHLDFFAGQNHEIIEPDPHNPQDVSSEQLWGFIELTYVQDPSSGKESLTVNLSFVDWVSLPLGMNVTYMGENGTAHDYVPGLHPDGLIVICDALSRLDSFWPKLCLKSQDNKPLRVMSPAKYVSLYPDDKDAADYYAPYVDRMWKKYQDVDLQINTQVDSPTSDGNKVANGQMVTCRVGRDDDILHCDQEAGDFQRPTSKDIWGCDSGPFQNPPTGTTETWSRARVRPRLCAAFTRSTLDFGCVQPSADIGPHKYYLDPITNHYARLVHENLIGGMGYAFSYDDVNPDSTSNSAGLISREGAPGEMSLSVLVNI